MSLDQNIPEPIQLSPDLNGAWTRIGGKEGMKFREDEDRDPDEDKDNDRDVGNDGAGKGTGYIQNSAIQEPGWRRKWGVVRAVMPN